MKVKSMGGSDIMNVRSVSVSENACMYFWQGADCVQIIKHPGSLWDVDVHEMIDSAGTRSLWAISACSDGTIRLFSTNPNDWLPKDVRVEMENWGDGIAQLFESVRSEREPIGSVFCVFSESNKGKSA